MTTVQTIFAWIARVGVAPELTRGVALNGVVCALIWLHSKGAVHGDIKPDNVFVSSSADRVFLADFGLCSFVPTNKAARKLQIRVWGV